MTQPFHAKAHPTAISGTDGFPMTTDPSGTPADKFASFDELTTLFLNAEYVRQDHGGAATVNTVTTGATPAIDISLGNYQKLTLSVNASPTITNFTNGEFTLLLTQPATAKTVTWPAAVKWAGGTPPTISGSNAVHLLRFVTFDGGTTIIGFPLALAVA